jgi:glycolate oxidase iron-sulfur subunit
MESLRPKLGKVTAIPARTAAVGTRRRTVGLLTGCVQGTFFPDVNAATVRVLAAEGCDVVVPQRQGCCGALSAHGGREAEALGFAKSVIAAFEAAGVETGRGERRRLRLQPQGVRPPAARRAGLGARAEALAGKVRDVTELLDELGPVAQRHPLPIAVAYQDACHLAHAQGIREQPRRLLRGIPGSSCASWSRRRSAAAAPAPTTCCSRSRPGSSASARPARCSPPAPT